MSWYAEVVAMKTGWQLLVIHGVLGQCLATQAEKRSDARQRQADIKGKGSLLLPPHSAPPASESSHSGVMKASTHTFHSTFRVQNVRGWPLSLWSSLKSTPVLCRSSYGVAQTFLTSGHTRAKSSPNIYGFCPQGGTGYGLLRLYGL